MTTNPVGNDRFAGFVRRSIRALGRRAGEDIASLADLADLRREVDDALAAAVASLRSEEGGAYSWTDIGRTLGISKQAAMQRFPEAGGARRPGGQPGGLR